MYFYLKETKSKSKTLILFKYKNKKDKRFVYSTKVSIFPKDWDFKTKFVKSIRGRTDLHIIAKKINVFLTFFELLLSNYELKDIKLTHEILTNEFKHKFENEKTILTVIDWFDILIKEKKDLKTKTHQKYTTAKNCLIKFEKSTNKQLTFETFTDFTAYIKYVSDVLKYNDNTLSRHLRFIKTFLNWAYKKKLHDIRDFSTLTSKSYETDHVALTKAQVIELYNYDFKNDRLQKVIDVFLIGCFTGQRFSDFSIFDKIDYNEHYISTRQKKTKVKVVIPVDANIMLKTLLYKYDFDLPTITPQNFNPYLREAVSKLESFQHKVKKTSYRSGKPNVLVCDFWEMIASHTARRTFITLTLEQGWTYKEVMQVSGITDIRTLMKYDKVSKDRLSEKTKKIWS